MTVRNLMTVREAAEYLRLGERKIYDLVSRGEIPCTKITGKLLFPRVQLDLWIASHVRMPDGLPALPDRPPVIAGSHDQLLEWAVRQSDCKLALLMEGSGEGLVRFRERGAVACGLHVIDPDSGVFNTPILARSVAGVPYVQIHWARREVGLVLPPGNPQGIRTPSDVLEPGIRFADRPPQTGAHILFRHLLRQEGRTAEVILKNAPRARNEVDVAALIIEGKADVGFAVRAAANRFGLTFVPLAWDSFDLVIERRDYFEAPFQKLLGFAAGPDTAEHARMLGGYDLTGLGAVRTNASGA